jgi:hypothetical protein
MLLGGAANSGRRRLLADVLCAPIIGKRNAQPVIPILNLWLTTFRRNNISACFFTVTN